MNAAELTSAAARPRPSAIRRVALAVSDAVLPQTCAVCGTWIPSGGSRACDGCLASFEAILWRSYCHRCARTIRPESLDHRGCFRCRNERIWNIAGIARAGPYMHPLSTLIVGLKYGGRERNAAYLAELMAEALCGRSWLVDVEALVPVPMHWRRRMQRSCNHALLLTQELARRLEIPLLRGIRRARYAPSQMRFDAVSKAKLFKNVKGCFALSRLAGLGWRSVRGRTVCIVDNIVRSGATIHEVSKVLRKAGAKRIYAAIAARTVPSGDVQAKIDAVPADVPP